MYTYTILVRIDVTSTYQNVTDAFYLFWKWDLCQLKIRFVFTAAIFERFASKSSSKSSFCGWESSRLPTSATVCGCKAKVVCVCVRVCVFGLISCCEVNTTDCWRFWNCTCACFLKCLNSSSSVTGQCFNFLTLYSWKSPVSFIKELSQFTDSCWTLA